eukprot:scaffold64805_cov27-Tisochrysis_lutea.AAC.1
MSTASDSASSAASTARHAASRHRMNSSDCPTCLRASRTRAICSAGESSANGASTSVALSAFCRIPSRTSWKSICVSLRNSGEAATRARTSATQGESEACRCSIRRARRGFAGTRGVAEWGGLCVAE